MNISKNKENPIKPLFENRNGMGHFYYCAVCDNRVPVRRNLIDQITYPYCPYCGYRFDWSEVYGDDWEDIVYMYNRLGKRGSNKNE